MRNRIRILASLFILVAVAYGQSVQSISLEKLHPFFQSVLARELAMTSVASTGVASLQD